jgi:hypothetical protein
LFKEGEQKKKKTSGKTCPMTWENVERKD